MHKNNWKFPAGAREQKQVINYKVLHGLRPPFLKEYLSPITSNWPIRTGRQDILRVRSIRNVHPVGSLKRAFLVVAPYLWNISFPPLYRVQLAPPLLLFQKGLNMVLSMGLGTTKGDGADQVDDFIVPLLPWGRRVGFLMGFYVVLF